LEEGACCCSVSTEGNISTGGFSGSQIPARSRHKPHPYPALAALRAPQRLTHHLHRRNRPVGRFAPATLARSRARAADPESGRVVSR
jgi:hypothetical protein